VKRISLSTVLYRAAMTGFLDAINEVKDKGEFTFVDRIVTTPEVLKRDAPTSPVTFHITMFM
jgi:2-methylisocitrate lyase-like PEP mutase family enzyme